MSETMKTSYATCPLCEATCGLEIVTQGNEILSIKGDAQDVFSHGYLCPKAYSLKELHSDPDRLTTPMIRRDDRWLSVSWSEAFAEVQRRLAPILERGGPNAVALYAGNPNAHTLAGSFYLPTVIQTLRSRNFYSASTVDQMPKQVSAGLMFGTAFSVPIPDIERTSYLLLLGANPLVSNGSLMTAPNMRDRLRSLRRRGGKVVVIDPYRTRTALEADEHHRILPGRDAYFLFALVHTLFDEGLVQLGALSEHTTGIEQVQALAGSFSPEQVANACSISSADIRRIACELAAAPAAAVYGRIGTCTQTFGTLASWLVDVLNVLTGNLDREGGALFPKAAAGSRNTNGLPGKGRGVRLGRWQSRVRGLAECFGELPVACLAEEIETPGEGQVKALITLAGNPLLSTPNSHRLRRAFATLECISVDFYLNETTSRAHVILPPPPPLARSHYDVAFYQLSARNIANYSLPVVQRAADSMDEWEIYLRLLGILSGQGPAADLQTLDDMVASTLVQREVATKGSVIEGRDPAELLALLQPQHGPDRLLDFLLRSGPYGDGFSSGETGLSLAQLKANPHGIDLGPLQPRIPEVLRTPSGKIELAPPQIVQDVERLNASLASEMTHDKQMLLVGRRDLRSNNSWMHNLHTLTKGPDRCTLHIHPDDATRLALTDGELACVTSRAGSVDIALEVTDAIMPGVVSIPHGWGHGQPGSSMKVAAEHAGVNTNILADEEQVDAISGNAALSGIPVTVAKIR
jgi:anaerobic selenocysteine-containing dehydrogenase